MNLKANSKLLQQHLQSSTGKCVILKDISNLKNDMKKHNGYNRNDLQALVNKLQRKEGIAPHLYIQSHALAIASVAS